MASQQALLHGLPVGGILHHPVPIIEAVRDEFRIVSKALIRIRNRRKVLQHPVVGFFRIERLFRWRKNLFSVVRRIADESNQTLLCSKGSAQTELAIIRFFNRGALQFQRGNRIDHGIKPIRRWSTGSHRHISSLADGNGQCDERGHAPECGYGSARTCFPDGSREPA